jgi:hypothetical protein
MRRTILWVASLLASLTPWFALPLSLKLAHGDPEGSIYAATYFGAFSFVITAPLTALASLEASGGKRWSSLLSLSSFGLVCLPTLAFQTVQRPLR